MVKEPRTFPTPHDETTVPVRRYAPLQDTRPMPGVTLPPAPESSPIERGRGRSRRYVLLLALFLLISFAVGTAAGGYALWQWSGTRPRTNVLILGLDSRPDQGNVVRSDTLILATAYPPGPRVALLSIPRDLYVDVPGYGPNRINTAHFWGEIEIEGGGPPLAMQTVAQNLGVPVHHYARVDFDGFRAIVDAVGGVEVIVEQPIVDDAYPTADYGTIHILRSRPHQAPAADSDRSGPADARTQGVDQTAPRDPGRDEGCGYRPDDLGSAAARFHTLPRWARGDRTARDRARDDRALDHLVWRSGAAPPLGSDYPPGPGRVHALTA
jgi:LCP family protein required for cell wall assembly